MAKVSEILCLCLVLWQLSMVEMAKRYCACVKLAENQLFMATCERCKYHRDSNQGCNNLNSSQHYIRGKYPKPYSSFKQEDMYTIRGEEAMCKKLQDGSDGEGDRNLFKDFCEAEGVSAGVVVAVVIITFVLGLLIMWLIMKYCTKAVLQDIRHKVVRTGEMRPPSRATQQPIKETTNTYEAFKLQRPQAPPGVDSNRTSYEELQGERMSSIYNVIDPEYQTSDRTDTKTQQTTGEYYILERENSSSSDSASDRNKKENTVVAVVLETRNVATTGNNRSGDMGETSQHISHDYFILEKENNTN